MKERTPKLVRTYYGWIFGAFTLVVGALFLWKVLSLYITGTAPDYEGASPFTRERVVEALSQISLAFWLWIAAIIAGFVLWEVFPVKQKQRKIPDDLQYARLAKRLPDSAPQGLEQDFALVERGRKLIFALKVAAWSLFAIAAIYGIVYLAIPGNFPNKDVTAEMLNMAKHVFPCIFAGLVVIAGAAVYEKYAVKSMLPSVKKLTFGLKPRERRPFIERVLSNKWIALALIVALYNLVISFIGYSIAGIIIHLDDPKYDITGIVDSFINYVIPCSASEVIIIAVVGILDKFVWNNKIFNGANQINGLKTYKQSLLRKWVKLGIILASINLLVLIIFFGQAFLTIYFMSRNSDIITNLLLSFVKHIIPCILLEVIILIGIGILEKYSKNIAIDFFNQTESSKENIMNLAMQCLKFGVRLLLLAIAVVLIIWGSLNGNARAIMIKAINICTECIGLG